MPTYKEILNSLGMPPYFNQFRPWYKDFWALEWQGSEGFEYLQQDAIEVIVIASILTSIRRYGTSSYHKIVSGDACFVDIELDGTSHPSGIHGPSLKHWDFCPRTTRGNSPYTQRAIAPINAEICLLIKDDRPSLGFDAHSTAAFLAFLSKPFLVFGEDGKSILGSNITATIDDRLGKLLIQIFPFLSFILCLDYSRPGDQNYYYHDQHIHVAFNGTANLLTQVW